eukprot:gene1424-1798_t
MSNIHTTTTTNKKEETNNNTSNNSYNNIKDNIILIIPNEPDEFHSNSNLLFQLIGYKFLEFGKTVYPLVYIFGKKKSFTSFQLHLDTFIYDNRLYRVSYHPDVQFSSDNELMLFTVLSGIPIRSTIANVYKYIEYYQFPTFDDEPYPSCRQIPTLISDLKHWGLGNALHFIPYQLLLSSSTNLERMLSLRQAFFAYGDWSSLFLGISKCDFYDFGDFGGKDKIINFRSEFLARPVWELKKTKLFYYQDIMLRTKDVSAIYDGMETRYELNHLEMVSILMDWSIRPSLIMRNYMSKTRHQLFGPSLRPNRCISMHVRHGDKNLEMDDREIIPFSNYHQTILDLIEPIEGTSSITTIYLMTDDIGVINEAKELNGNQTRYQYIYQTPILPDTTKNMDLYGHQLYTDIDIASECDYFIGTMSSNLGRFIIELGLSKSNYLNYNHGHLDLDNTISSSSDIDHDVDVYFDSDFKDRKSWPDKSTFWASSISSMNSSSNKPKVLITLDSYFNSNCLQFKECSSNFNWSVSPSTSSDIFIQNPIGATIQNRFINRMEHFNFNQDIMEEKKKFISSKIGDTWKTSRIPLASWIDDDLKSCQNESSPKIKYMKELMNLIPIDSFGGCLHNTDYQDSENEINNNNNRVYNLKDISEWNNNSKFKSTRKILERYKFTIVSDGYLCKGYILDRVYEALMYGTVPIVFSHPSNLYYLPRDSFIYAGDFKSPKDLANHLIHINDNIKEYKRYFNWRTNPNVLNQWKNHFEFSFLNIGCAINDHFQKWKSGKSISSTNINTLKFESDSNRP